MNEVWVGPAALKAMLEHGKSQLENGLEVGGVITGREENGSVLVTHAIPLSVGEKTTVEITPELFAEAYRIKEASGIEDPIIGWYHSHPGYSCFMSELDKQAHRSMLNLYRDAIAIVLDPLLYTDEKPSSEYFRVFTLANGKVKEIPSDIDGSRKSKDEMFRRFASGKETIIERVIYKQPQKRSWTPIVSVAFLIVILIMGLSAVGKLRRIEGDLADDGRIGSQIFSMKKSIDNSIEDSVDGAVKSLKGEFETRLGSITDDLASIKKMVENRTFEVTAPMFHSVFYGDSTTITIGVSNTGNVSNEYIVEVPDFPDWNIDPQYKFHLEPGEEKEVSISIPGFVSDKQETQVTIEVRDSEGTLREKIVNLKIVPRITFTVGDTTLDLSSFSGDTFKYSYNLNLGEEKYFVRVATVQGDTTPFSIEYRFEEDQGPVTSIVVDDEQHPPDMPFPFSEVVILEITPTEDTESFVLTIVITDGSGEQYVLTLIFEQKQE